MKPMNLSKRNALRVRDLAVSYHAYMTAKTDNAMIVWGRILLEAMAATGVELHKAEHVREDIELALYREKRAAA